MIWLHVLTYWMHESLSKLWELVMDRHLACCSHAVTEPDKTERWHNSPVHGGMKVQVSPHRNHTLGIGICS